MSDEQKKQPETKQPVAPVKNSRDAHRDTAEDVASEIGPDIYGILRNVACGNNSMQTGKLMLRAWLAELKSEELDKLNADKRTIAVRMQQAAEGLGQELLSLLS